MEYAMRASLFKNLIAVLAVFFSITLIASAQCPDWITWAPNQSPGYEVIYLDDDPECCAIVTFCWTELADGQGILYIHSVEYVGDCDTYQLEFETDPLTVLERYGNIIFDIYKDPSADAIYPCSEDEWPVDNENHIYNRIGWSSCWGNPYVIGNVPPNLGFPEGTTSKKYTPCYATMTEYTCWIIFYYCYDNTVNPPVLRKVERSISSQQVDCPEGCTHICQ
jgi:hypothetical protein